MAEPSAMTRTPEARGSSVPAWPTRRWPDARRIRATTSWEVGPTGLSTAKIASMVGVGGLRAVQYRQCGAGGPEMGEGSGAPPLYPSPPDGDTLRSALSLSPPDAYTLRLAHSPSPLMEIRFAPGMSASMVRTCESWVVPCPAPVQAVLPRNLGRAGQETVMRT